MYAIIETGGKQYRVSPGDRINVEKVSAGAGADISLGKVLAVVKDDKSTMGTPYVEGAEIKAEVIGSGKAKKVIVYKQRPRKVYRKLRGHRQSFTTIKIKEIVFGG